MPVTADDRVLSDFAAMGVAFEAEAPGDDDGDTFAVWACNWESVTAFLGCQTQWRTAPRNRGYVHLGLDYGAVDIVLRRMGAADRVFEDLQDMELAALAAFGELV
ncbi:DUF1799 domain-containing protein [Puniceibacterium sp. IMCC21224]|uniref:DUF1799 domain-containing protein n=1 Tax=Puniceibacterium sp. IMCC21224 TaxID=1618204 RepID=UPI00065D4796|nr:DUF1799 domain-containing protein [Puniceibacterium sp. IMCC21224]KMK68584.1 Phage related hypothetical protein (DUF1799) [Puniceibacterium sp. IMCC21224]